MVEQQDDTFSRTASTQKQAWRLALLCLLLALVASGVLFYFYKSYTPTDLDYMLLFAVASIVILLAMSGLYYHAYNFYHDKFYLFASVGWFCNALYIFFEGFFPGVRGQPEYGLWIDLLMIISLTPFYLAGTLTNASSEIKNLIVPALAASLWVLIKLVPFIDVRIKLGVATLGISVLAFYSLHLVADSLKARLNPSVHGVWASRLVFTFRAYAYLQFLYLATLIPHLVVPSEPNVGYLLYIEWGLRTAFGIGLLLKVLNMISALSIIRHDFSDLRIRLIHSQEELGRRSRFEEIGLLTASILHEILNPLGVIETTINLMKATYSKQEGIGNDLDRIEEQRQKIFNATKIIPYIRAERAFYESKMEKTNVGDLVNKSIKDLRAEINLTNVKFRLDNKVEGVEGVFFTRAIPHMLEEAFINVFKNSVEGIREARREQGSITIVMRIASKTRDQMRIQIDDNGCGIPPENIAKVKVPLFSTRRGQKPNSGLGLFVTEQIVKIHNGDLTITSTEDMSTTVSITLPLVEFRKKPPK